LAAPTIRAVGAIGSTTTGALSVPLPAGVVAGDLLVVFLETDAADTPSWPAGWNVGSFAVTLSSSTDTRLEFATRVATGSDACSITGTTDHKIARMVAITKDSYLGEFDYHLATGFEETVDTSGSITGPTTAVAECLVLAAISVGLDPPSNVTTSFSGWTNANLSSLTERMDDSRIDGNGGSLGMASGVKDTAGAVGNTTVTTPNGYKATICLAFKPATPPVTPKNDTDSGSGSEGLSFLAQYSITDTGAGVEETQFRREVPDLAAGIDAVLLFVPKSSSQTGVGTDNATVAAVITANQAATGTDVAPESYPVNTFETGAGTDASATRREVADAGTDSEIAVSSRVLPDFGGDTEVSTLVAQVSNAQTGAGVDATALAVGLSVSDSGAGIEDSGFSVLRTDFVIGVDGASTSRAVSDFGGATEIRLVNLIVSDSGTALEIILGIRKTTGDVGNSSDAAMVALGDIRIASESGTGSDTALITFRVTVSDTGTSSETGQSGRKITASDSGVVAENAAPRILSNESGLGNDVTGIQRPVTEIGAGLETQSILTISFKQGSDIGSGSETYVLDRKFVFSDSGTSTENGLPASRFVLPDSGTSTENAGTTKVLVQASDNATGHDLGTQGLRFLVSDSGSSTENGGARLLVPPKFHESVLLSANGQPSTLIAVNDLHYVGS
jgi:hypothetical protein